MAQATVPAFVHEQLEKSCDPVDLAAIEEGFEAARTRPVTLRANTLQASAEEVADALDAAGLSHSRVSWYGDAFIMGEGVRERDLWELPLYREGKIYLQSLSSMLPPLALAPRTGADILDMCAAPGGKTSQIAALTGGAAHLTALEMSAVRAEKLEYNLAKLGVKNVPVLKMDARRLDEFFSFDQILLDAPCTGSGTFVAGDERAAGRITPQLLAKVTKSQRALLDRALTVLKPGGTLVYSTCSVFSAENEEIVSAALKRHRDCEIKPAPLVEGLLAAQDGPRVVETDLPDTLTVAPSRLYEGFFVCLIEKKAPKKKN